MHFQYKNHTLYCENVSVARIIQQLQTPCYIYSYRALIEQFQRIQKAFQAVNPLICYAMKANDNLAVIKTLIDQGAGCDIVSGGELAKALKAKANSKKIVFASVGKTDEEITAALKAGILFFNVESLAELTTIDQLAKTLKKTARVALRINPDIHAPTHDRIVTGTLDKKFGIDLNTARSILQNRSRYAHTDICGIHMHIGSQIKTTAPYVHAVNRVAAFLKELANENIHLTYFNMGGGFGISYDEHHPEHIEEFAAALIPILKSMNLKIIMEPGRFLTGNAGIFITKTLYIKDNGVKKFIIVDAGMNDFPRPSLYDAHHEIIPVKQTDLAPADIFDIVGPICESGDFFAKARPMPAVQRGDLLAIKSAGAYCYAMASNYNVRGRAPEVMVKGNVYAVIKKRETIRDLMRGESIPDFL